MSIFKITSKDLLKIQDGNEIVEIIEKGKYDSYKPDILGLGDISSKSTTVNAVCAIFDLGGFTKFCSKIDPQLVVPEFLTLFLDWLFKQQRKDFITKEYEKGYYVYCNLPFLSKFMGDGVLFLWETDEIDEVAICNIIGLIYNICFKYKTDFLQSIKDKIAEPPETLRCGIARGKVYSVGDGNDYVGPCINLAARLQKFSQLTLCISRRGFNIDRYMGERVKKLFVVKKAKVRGIGDNELIIVLKNEFDKLSPEEKALFKDI